jgi:hypothetical protein
MLSVRRYSKSLLVHEDEPEYGTLLRLLFLIVPAGLLISSRYLWSTGESEGGAALLAETFLIGFIFWIVFPRKYQVYEDHLAIALGGPVSIKIGFEKIAAVEITGRTSMTMNFVTRFARTYVRIARKGAMSIAITPKSYDQFVEHANRAIREWEGRGNTTNKYR